MKKQLLPEDIKVVSLDAAIEREDFTQIIIPTTAAGTIKLASTAVGYPDVEAEVEVTAEQAGINIQFDLDLAYDQITITGATGSGVLASKEDVKDVRGHVPAGFGKINQALYSVERGE